MTRATARPSNSGQLQDGPRASCSAHPNRSRTIKTSASQLEAGEKDWVINVEHEKEQTPLFVAFILPRSRFPTIRVAVDEILAQYVGGDGAELQQALVFSIADTPIAIARPGQARSSRIKWLPASR